MGPNEDELDEDFDPAFCAFCQDALPHGKMLLVVRFSQKIVGGTGFATCARCGIGYTDRPVMQNKETGEIAVFQFEHDDFKLKRVQDRIEPLTEIVTESTCHVCGEITERDEDLPDYLSNREFATKMLRMYPNQDEVTITCGSCANLGICPCCNEDD
jgi:hypothetical protein